MESIHLMLQRFVHGKLSQGLRKQGGGMPRNCEQNARMNVIWALQEILHIKAKKRRAGDPL